MRMLLVDSDGVCYEKFIENGARGDRLNCKKVSLKSGDTEYVLTAWFLNDTNELYEICISNEETLSGSVEVLQELVKIAKEI